MLSSDSLIVYKLDSIYETTIVKRPSAFCKTPYVADIEINGIPAMAHTPALGCCGLSDKDSQVMVSSNSCVQFPINQPASPNSQIQEFLD